MNNEWINVKCDDGFVTLRYRNVRITDSKGLQWVERWLDRTGSPSIMLSRTRVSGVFYEESKPIPEYNDEQDDYLERIGL